MVSASLGGHLTPFLTQIPVQLATVQGKRLTASGQAQESNHTGRGVGHDEEMNQQKCPQVPTAPGYRSESHNASSPPQGLPRVPGANSNDQGCEWAQSVPNLVPKGSLALPQES